MHPTVGTAPGGIGARPFAVAVLAAVVLVLLAGLGLTGPGTTGEAVVGAAAAAGHHGDAPPRTDDACDTACSLRTATRQEPHSEHPAPRGHLATCGHGTVIAPPGLARPSARTGHLPSSGTHAVHDRGRAPPVFSGT
ncbi:hypothetical protein [Streptomyces bullii]|uniref:Uncharacterized protein n=1 Tax=Streptomyces bullii TaxID=349910 RepID=A0ABW0UWA7_9ACTN